MTLILRKLGKKGLSVNTAPYRVTLKSGKMLYYRELLEIARDVSAQSVETIYDRKKHRWIRYESIGHRKKRKQINPH
jgi:hypothetical protein